MRYPSHVFQRKYFCKCKIIHNSVTHIEELIQMFVRKHAITWKVSFTSTFKTIFVDTIFNFVVFLVIYALQIYFNTADLYEEKAHS